MPVEKSFGAMLSCVEHRYLPAVLAIVAIVLMLPALNAGFIQDDLVHRVKLIDPSRLPDRLPDTGVVPPGSGTLRTALRDLHAFARSQDHVKNLMESGAFPWWTGSDLRLANWRPLDSFFHWLDYRLFPDSPTLMHVHSAIWFAAVIFLVTVLYRRLMTPLWVAALAALFYTLDDANYFPAAWIANRHQLPALFFAILVLLMHDRWRRHNSAAAAVAAPFFLLLSLLSTEAGIAAFAYLFAFALTIDRGPWRRRLAGLAPALLVIVFWRVIYNAMGNGAAGSGFIIDPAREPLRYASALPKRALILLMGQWGWQPAEMLDLFSHHARTRQLLIGAAFLLLILVVLLPLLRKDRVALFWFTGMLLCILPICATVPMNRNLLFAAIGAFGLTAQFIAGLFTKQSWVPTARFWRVPAWILCFTLLFINVPVAIAARISAPKAISFIFNTFESTIDIGSHPNFESQTVVVVNAPNPFLFVGLPFYRAFENQPLPEKTRVLSPAFGPLEIMRTDEKTLMIKTHAGSLFRPDTSRQDDQLNFVYLYHHLNSLFRPPEARFSVGERIQLTGMSVEVAGVDAHGRPNELLIRFDVPLEDPSLHWLQWNWKELGFGSYSPFKPPAVTQKSYLPGPFD
jgi:hypothetical protein